MLNPSRPPSRSTDRWNGLDLLHTTTLTVETATAWITIKQCVEYSHRVNRILGVGLDNAEVAALPGSVVFAGTRGFPPHLFKDVYAFASENGFFKTAHAGEEGPPAYVWDAIVNDSVQRIDHGVRAAEDPKLLSYMATKQANLVVPFGHAHRLPLTVCPLSNYKLKVFPQGPELNLLNLIDDGVLATVNSDDPAYFGGYAADNFEFVARMCAKGCGGDRAREISLRDIGTLAKNGFKACWGLDQAEKDAFEREVDGHIASLHLGI